MAASVKSVTAIGNVSSVNIATQNVSTAEKNYTINIDKTLLKKIKATNRPSVEYKYTDGGITATFDTVSFELFKLSLSEYYTHYPLSKGVVETHFDKDKKNNVVQVIYRVKPSEGCGYTINLYTTRSSVLINGKSANLFMHKDLKCIHQIMANAKFNNEKVDIARMNKVLQEQLVALLNAEKQADISNVDQELQERKICYVCKRNVKTRAILCDTGNHWVHYRCDRLSEEQILSLEQDDKGQYCCKMCSGKVAGSHSIELTLPKLTCVKTDTQTCAEKLLDEQVDCDRSECGICSEMISSQDEESCDCCNALVHTNCAVGVSGLIYCDGCVASLSQVEQTKVGNGGQLNVSTDGSSEKSGNVVTSEVIDNISGSSVGHVDNSSISHKTNADFDNADFDCQLIEDSQPSSGIVSKPNTNVPKNSKFIKNSHNSESKQDKDNSVKQSDVRQLELKLKKKHEELKIQETKLIQSKDDKLRLESYIQKIEARNDELVQSNRLLRRRIVMLEENVKAGAVNESTHNNVRDAGPNDTEQLMVGIRDRFTRFVLSRVDQQIAMLENSNISSSNGNLCFPTSTQILCQPNANMQPAYIHPSLVHNQPQDLNNSSESHSFTPTNFTNNVIQGPFAFIPPPYPSLNVNSNLVNSNVQLNQSKRPYTQVNIPSSTEKSGNHYKQSTDTANCIPSHSGTAYSRTECVTGDSLNTSTYVTKNKTNIRSGVCDGQNSFLHNSSVICLDDTQ